MVSYINALISLLIDKYNAVPGSDVSSKRTQPSHNFDE